MLQSHRLRLHLSTIVGVMWRQNGNQKDEIVMRSCVPTF